MKLVERARVLLRLPGGPPDELAPGEIAKAARAVEKLHQGLVGDRALARPQTYHGEMLGAYLLWWWPQTYAKVQAALRMAAFPRAPRTILDVGSGPAPAAIAALDLFGGEATCFDASEEALAEARFLGITRTTRELPEDRFDLTIAANVLSELSNPLDFVRKLTGTIVIVEPALKGTSRALLAIRDELLRDGFYAVAPCLTQKPCPALASPRDWCTAAVRWDPPRFFRQLADATGLKADEMISYSPLILSRERLAAPSAGLFRVVGVPPPEKGKRRIWVCNDEGRLPAVRLDKHASAENADFDSLDRGDLVHLGGLELRPDGLRIGQQSHVARR